MIRRFRQLCVVGVLFLSSMAQAAPLVRGPFLQNQTADSVTVCWDLKAEATATIRLMDAEGALMREIPAPAASRHEVVIDGLQPAAKYRYEVLHRGVESAGGGAITGAPERGTPFSFVVWGDSRDGINVCRELGDFILESGIAMCVHTGDMVNDGKEIYQWNKYFFEPLDPMMRSVVLWPVIGNHDLGWMPGEEKQRSVFQAMYAAPEPEHYYSVDYGDAHFLILDSESPSEAMYEFAEKDLAATDAKWIFAAWHRPPFSSSHHPSDIRMRSRYLPLLAKHNVDAIFVGHNHNYMLSKPIRHMYEPAQTRSYLQVVTGGGGAYPADFRTDNRWFDRAQTAFHVVVIEIDGEVLRGRAVNARGRVLDRFEVNRTVPAAKEVAFELIELERILGESSITNNTLDGWPTGHLVAADVTSSSLVFAVKNPLPEPITITVSWSPPPGLRTAAPVRELTVEAGAAASVAFPFALTGTGDVYPIPGPVCAFESPLGAGTVAFDAPPLGFMRRVEAVAASAPVIVDGSPGDAAWIGAPVHGDFVLWANRDLRVQDAGARSTLRAVHDEGHLYLLLTRPAAGLDFENLPDSLGETDRFSLYVAAPSIALGVDMDAAGRFETTGTRGLGEKIQAASSRSEGAVHWEIAIPLEDYRQDMAAKGGGLVLNVNEHRGREIWNLSPTMKQFASRANAAPVVFR